MPNYQGKIYKGKYRLDNESLQGLKNFFEELEEKERKERERGINNFVWWNGESRRCFLCLEIGHLNWKCPLRKKYYCRFCTNFGHLPKACPNYEEEYKYKYFIY